MDFSAGPSLDPRGARRAYAGTVSNSLFEPDHSCKQPERPNRAATQERSDSWGAGGTHSSDDCRTGYRRRACHGCCNGCRIGNLGTKEDSLGLQLERTTPDIPLISGGIRHMPLRSLIFSNLAYGGACESVVVCGLPHSRLRRAAPSPALARLKHLLAI